MKKYDYLVVGAGLYGTTFARLATDAGKRVLVVDRRDGVGGNVRTRLVEGIHVHGYGAHVFHTNERRVWDFACRFAEFNRFTNSPVANNRGELYSLPFNMWTFNRIWGVVTPEEAKAEIGRQRAEAGIGEPRNLEEQAASLVGRDVYEKLIRDYLENRDRLDALADRVVFTGPIDEFYGFRLGALEYLSVRFETEAMDIPNFQGVAAMNHVDSETPWTRTIEHKWFQFGKDDDGNDLPKTVVSREYSSEWKPGVEPYYPIGDARNLALYAGYADLASAEADVVFGGHLGEYKYHDMDRAISSAMDFAERELSR